MQLEREMYNVQCNHNRLAALLVRGEAEMDVLGVRIVLKVGFRHVLGSQNIREKGIGKGRQRNLKPSPKEVRLIPGHLAYFC